MTVEQIEDPSARLGDYLLKGWTMMGDVCEDCPQGIPLMRSKAQDQLICVACMKDYLAKPEIPETPIEIVAESTTAKKPSDSLFSKYLISLEKENCSLKTTLRDAILTVNNPTTDIETKLKNLEFIVQLKNILS